MIPREALWIVLLHAKQGQQARADGVEAGLAVVPRAHEVNLHCFGDAPVLQHDDAIGEDGRVTQIRRVGNALSRPPE